MTQAPRELTIEIPDDERDATVKSVEAALAGATDVLWLVDTRGKRVGVPSAKLAYEVREQHYDLVVVDAEASGHIVAQIGAPRVIRELVQVGMVREQTAWMTEILEDPARTGRHAA